MIFYSSIPTQSLCKLLHLNKLLIILKNLVATAKAANFEKIKIGLKKHRKW